MHYASAWHIWLFTITDLEGKLIVNNRALSVSNQRSGQDERVRMLRIASHLGEWTQKLP